jgi:hypothetical protein
MSNTSTEQPIDCVSSNTRNKVRIRNKLQQSQRDNTELELEPYIDFISYIRSVNTLINSYADKYKIETDKYIEIPGNVFNRTQRCRYRSMQVIIQDFNDKIKLWYKDNIDLILDITVNAYNKEYIDLSISNVVKRLDIMRHNITYVTTINT